MSFCNFNADCTRIHRNPDIASVATQSLVRHDGFRLNIGQLVELALRTLKLECCIAVRFFLMRRRNAIEADEPLEIGRFYILLAAVHGTVCVRVFGFLSRHLPVKSRDHRVFLVKGSFLQIE